MERIYYIGTGDQTKMYTLRTQYQDFISTHTGRVPIIRDYYLQNLSTDAEKAVSRAKELGFEVKKPKFSLQEIRRREERLSQIEREKLIAEERAARQAFIDKMMAPIENGRFPFGKYRDERFEDVFEKDRGYMKYWVNNDIRKDDVVAYNLQRVLSNLYGEQLKPVTGNGEYFGEVKKRYRGINAKVVNKFSFETFYGYTRVVKFVLESGEMAVYMGSSFIDVAEGDEVTIDFTVKAHEEYEGEIQTKILRVKVKE
tara:strand:- start:43 stop:810 length:768 start_codon:yes stop_codon:yes gene_type:complete